MTCVTCVKVDLMSSPDRVFTSARKVLQGACHMVAMQLATEPLVRQAVRQVFQTRALLTVKPTKKGKKVRLCALYTSIHLLSGVAHRGRGAHYIYIYS